MSTSWVVAFSVRSPVPAVSVTGTVPPLLPSTASVSLEVRFIANDPAIAASPLLLAPDVEVASTWWAGIWISWLLLAPASGSAASWVIVVCSATRDHFFVVPLNW